MCIYKAATNIKSVTVQLFPLFTTMMIEAREVIHAKRQTDSKRKILTMKI